MRITYRHTIRSREISASIILQSQSQLKAIYKDAAEIISDNCDCTLFLSGRGKNAKEIADVLGKETIDSYNQSENRGAQTSHGLNYQKLGKDLPNADDYINAARQLALTDWMDWSIPNSLGGDDYVDHPEWYRGGFDPWKDTFRLTNPTVEAAGTPTVTQVEPVYIGRTVFTNNSTTGQTTLATQAYEQMVTNEVSATTTHSVGVSVTASGGFQVPVVGQLGVSLTASYDFSQSNTNTDSKTIVVRIEP